MWRKWFLHSLAWPHYFSRNCFILISKQLRAFKFEFSNYLKFFETNERLPAWELQKRRNVPVENLGTTWIWHKGWFLNLFCFEYGPVGNFYSFESFKKLTFNLTNLADGEECSDKVELFRGFRASGNRFYRFTIAWLWFFDIYLTKDEQKKSS